MPLCPFLLRQGLRRALLRGTQADQIFAVIKVHDSMPATSQSTDAHGRSGTAHVVVHRLNHLDADVDQKSVWQGYGGEELKFEVRSTDQGLLTLPTSKAVWIIAL